MSIVIVICFIVCWTPYYLLGLWYWFFPDDLEGKVSHSLTHILFIFGLFNACLDPIIYGLFTIRFQKGLRNCYHKAAVMSSLETNAVIMESLKCTGSVLPSKRGMTSGEKDISSEHAEAKSTDNIVWLCLVAGRGATLAFRCLFTELIGFTITTCMWRISLKTHLSIPFRQIMSMYLCSLCDAWGCPY